MKSTCISHPGRESIVMVRAWQIAFCTESLVNEANGACKRIYNQCAAMLLSHFEYWYNVKLNGIREHKYRNDVAQMHGEERFQAEDLYQYHTIDDLVGAVFGIYKRNKVIEAVDFLVKKGVISTHKNPTARYKFDKTKYFLFYPEVCQSWLDSVYTPAKARAEQGTCLSFMVEGEALAPATLYVNFSEGVLDYCCFTPGPNGTWVTDQIEWHDIVRSNPALRAPQNSDIETFTPLRTAILKITSKRGHTVSENRNTSEELSQVIDLFDSLYLNDRSFIFKLPSFKNQLPSFKYKRPIAKTTTKTTPERKKAAARKEECFEDDARALDPIAAANFVNEDFNASPSLSGRTTSATKERGNEITTGDTGNVSQGHDERENPSTVSSLQSQTPVPPASSHPGSSIGERLTPEQACQLQQRVSSLGVLDRLKRHYPSLTLASLVANITAVVLDKDKFTKSSDRFEHKLNTVCRQLAKGNIELPLEAKKAAQEMDSQKAREAAVRAHHQAIAGCQSDIERGFHTAAAVKSFQNEIAKRKAAISKLLQTTASSGSFV